MGLRISIANYTSSSGYPFTVYPWRVLVMVLEWANEYRGELMKD